MTLMYTCKSRTAPNTDKQTGRSLPHTRLPDFEGQDHNSALQSEDFDQDLPLSEKTHKEAYI
jgi:hypothetical protein